MKTKTVTLKGFIFNDLMQAWDGQDETHFRKSRDGVYSIQATLTFEVPIPERKVTITESEFDEAWSRANDRTGLFVDRDYLKSKLFKEPAHD